MTDFSSSPRAQNLTPYVLPQPEGSLASVKTIRTSSSTHLESLGGEKAVNSHSFLRGTRIAQNFLRRLSLRLHIIHHGEEQAENSSTRGNRPMADSANSLAHPLSIPEIIGG
jgi:hypothetical protein